MSYQKATKNQAYTLGLESDLKNRSNRKRVYKYSENEFNIEPTPSNRKTFKSSAYQSKDFSFQNKPNKQQPKKYKNQNITSDVPTFSNNQNTSVQPHNQSAKKKDYNLRLNNIDHLNDKITTLLHKVPKEQQKPLQSKNINYQTYNQSNYNYTSRYAQPVEQDTFKKQEKDVSSKRRISYADISHQRFRTPKNNQENVTTEYKYQEKLERNDKNSSPIIKYNESEQQQEYLNGKETSKYQRPARFQKISESIIKNTDQTINNNSNPSKSDYQDKYDYHKTQKSKKFEHYDNVSKQQQRKEINLIKNAELDYKIHEFRSRINRYQPTDFVNIQSDNLIQKLKESTIDRSFFHELTEQPTILKMAHQLSRIIDLDMVLRKIRMSFEHSKESNKLQTLKLQMRVKNVYIEQSELQEISCISLHQKNPFGQKFEPFPLNGCKDFAKIYVQIQRIWNEDVYKCVSLNNLALDHFEMSYIDINRKGSISIQDLVCFINVNTQKFYRSRDLCPLFRRFLKLEGKALQKNIGDGISYGTFMDRLCK